MSLKHRYCYAILLLVQLSGFCIAQQMKEAYSYNADAEHAFSTALQLFQERRFEESAAQFDTLTKFSTLHQRTTAAYLMAAKSYFELKHYDTSMVLMRELLERYPFTQYRLDAEYVLGISSMMLQRYADASWYLLDVVAAANDRKVSAEASQLFETLAKERLSTGELQQLLARLKNTNAVHVVILALAEKYFRAGDKSHAEEMLKKISDIDSTDILYQNIRRLRERVTSHVNLSIGVLLPSQQTIVTSGNKGLSDGVLEGIQFALDERNVHSPSNIQISLRVVGTEQDSLLALNRLQDVIERKDIIAVIGPLFSNLAMQYAPVINAAKIPMISPTATGEGLAAIGPYIFQSNPDYTTRGKAMARNAVLEMGYSRLAVLTSTDGKARAFADAFVREAKALGATILEYQGYGKDSSDLHDQFMNLRKACVGSELRVAFTEKITRQEIQAMLRAGADRDLLNETRKRHESIEVTKLFGPRGARIADSLHMKIYTPALYAQSTDIPVTTIQALCISVASAEEVGVVASQLSYFNIKTQILGSGEWYAPNELDAQKRYVNGAIFLADSYQDDEDSVYVEFEHSFYRDKGKLPTKNTMYGYDTMKMLLDQIDGGAMTRDQLTLSLSSVKKYHGVHSSISLEHHRVNTFVHILQYRNGTINNIAELSAY